MSIADSRWLVLATALLLAGCSDGTGALFPPTDEEAQASPLAEAPGVTLAIHVTGGGSSLRIHAEASNRGEETYLVPNACSDGAGAPHKDLAPFTIAARRSTGATEVLPIYPARGCSEVTTTPFSPGQTMEFEVEWDGTSWSTASSRQTVVEPGPHVVEVALQLHVASDPTPTPMVATVPIKVLDV